MQTLQTTESPAPTPRSSVSQRGHKQPLHGRILLLPWSIIGYFFPTPTSSPLPTCPGKESFRKGSPLTPHYLPQPPAFSSLFWVLFLWSQHITLCGTLVCNLLVYLSQQWGAHPQHHVSGAEAELRPSGLLEAWQRLELQPLFLTLLWLSPPHFSSAALPFLSSLLPFLPDLFSVVPLCHPSPTKISSRSA